MADDKGFSTIEKRIVSAGIRNGINTNSPTLWKDYFSIKQEIEKKIHKSIYRLLPNIEEYIYGYGVNWNSEYNKMNITATAMFAFASLNSHECLLICRISSLPEIQKDSKRSNS